MRQNTWKTGSVFAIKKLLFWWEQMQQEKLALERHFFVSLLIWRMECRHRFLKSFPVKQVIFVLTLWMKIIGCKGVCYYLPGKEWCRNSVLCGRYWLYGFVWKMCVKTKRFYCRGYQKDFLFERNDRRYTVSFCISRN